MTIDKAIEVLNEIKHYLCEGNPIWDTALVAEAIDMAVNRIESQPERSSE